MRFESTNLGLVFQSGKELWGIEQPCRRFHRRHFRQSQRAIAQTKPLGPLRVYLRALSAESSTDHLCFEWSYHFSPFSQLFHFLDLIKPLMKLYFLNLLPLDLVVLHFL